MRPTRGHRAAKRRAYRCSGAAATSILRPTLTTPSWTTSVSSRIAEAAHERTAATQHTEGTMSNQDRLNQLIDDAKRRQDERRRKELEQFQTEVQHALGQELGNLLDLTWRLDTPGGVPTPASRIAPTQRRTTAKRTTLATDHPKS